MQRRDFMLGSAASAGMIVSVAVRAQSRPCPMPILEVDGGGAATTSCSRSNSALSALVASMAPGTWAPMSPAPANLVSTLGVGSVEGNMIPYCNASPWNPVSKCIEIVGQDHNWGTLRHVRYDEAANAFGYAGGQSESISHGYDHTEVNPFTGDLYYKSYAYGTAGKIWRKSAGSSSWNTALTTVPEFQQVALGTCWWKGTLNGGGAQGALLIYNTQTGNIVGYNPIGGSWFAQSAAPASGSYHAVMAYSAVKNVAVFGGGGGGHGRRIWKLTANRTVTELANAPGNCQLGIYQGGLCCDPVTGDFLVLSGGALFALNPDGGGTWTQQSGTRVPPGAVSDPAAVESMVMCELPDHGAVAVISMNGSSNGNMYIYRHA